MFRHFFSFSAAYIENTNCYFSNNDFNGLFLVNLITKETKYIGKFPHEDVDQKNLHKKCVQYKETLFFLPECASNVHKYEFENKKISIISLKQYPFLQKHWLADACVLGQFLYLFPTKAEYPIVVINMENSEVSADYKLSEYIKKLHGVDNLDQVFTRVTVVRNEFVLNIYKTSFVLLYNPLNGSIRCVDTKIADLLAVFPYPDSLLLYTITNRLYIFDQDFEHFKEINLGDLKENIAKRFFQHFITVGRKIFAIPCQLDNIYVVETESWNIRRLDFPDDFYMYPDVRVKFWGFQLVNNDLYLFPQGSDEILRINTQTEKIEGKTFPVPFSNYEIEPYKEIYRVRKERLKKELQLKEGLFLRLHDFIDLIS